MKVFIWIAMLLSSLCLHAQNLVQNGSFEDYTDCPEGAGQVYYAVGWESWFWTPDYYHTCSSNPSLSVPLNNLGYQYPANGNGYFGLFGYWKSIPSTNVRDYIAQSLSAPLTIGKRYHFSMKISMAPNYSYCASDKIGVKFTTNSYAAYAGQYLSPLVNNQAILYVDTVVTDTTGWTTVSGDFIADSSYQYIVIGNFFDDNHTNTIGMWDPNICDGTYYYLDEVVLEENPFAANADTPPIIPVSLYNHAGKLILQSNTLEIIDVQVYNVLGQRLNALKMTPWESVSIDISPHTSGYYFVQIRTESMQITQPIYIHL